MTTFTTAIRLLQGLQHKLGKTRSAHILRQPDDLRCSLRTSTGGPKTFAVAMTSRDSVSADGHLTTLNPAKRAHRLPGGVDRDGRDRYRLARPGTHRDCLRVRRVQSAACMRGWKSRSREDPRWQRSPDW